MFSFAGVLSEDGDVAPELNRHLGGFKVGAATQLHCAYLGCEGDAGSIVAPAWRLGALLPKTRALIVSATPTHETMWEVSDAFAALCFPADERNRDIDSFDGALLARLAGAYLHRGVNVETAVARALDKFPAELSTLFLVRHANAPQLVATRNGPPIWIYEGSRCISVVGATSVHAAPDEGARAVQLGDTMILRPGSSAIVDADGMRMEKRSPAAWSAGTVAPVL